MSNLTLMSLTGVSSDYTFLCNKYGVRPTSTRDSIKDAETYAVMASLAAYFLVLIVHDLCVLYACILLCCLMAL